MPVCCLTNAWNNFALQVTRLELALALGKSREDNIRIELAEGAGRESAIRKQHKRALEEVGPRGSV